MTAKTLRFDAGNPDTYADDADALRNQLQTARQAWLDDRDDLDIADRHQHAMNEYAAARTHLREQAIANGTRGNGLGINVENNTEGA